jgi:ribonuclease-3 family protein
MIRKYLIELKLTDVNDLHKKAIQYTSAIAQAKIMSYFVDEHIITDDEYDVFKRGRNASGRGRKNTDAKTYTHATGFEALIGYLYLNHPHRADELIIKAIQVIEKG